MVSQETGDIMPEEGDIVIEVQPDNGTHISNEVVQDVLDYVDECFSFCHNNDAHLPAHEGISKKRKLSQPSSFKKQRISDGASSGSSTPWSPLYGGTRLDEDTIQYLHKFYCKDCQMDQQAAERARAGGGDTSPGAVTPMDVKQEGPMSPQQATDDASITGLLDKNKESLKRKLMMRRSLHELVDQGIYPPPKTPPAFMEQRKSLERAKTGDLLRYKIQHRPDRQLLVQQHILEDTNLLVDPSLHERQRLLKKARLTDSLNDKLSHRPGILELVQGNILQPDGTLHQLIKDGSISFDKTCDEDDLLDDKSSDEAFSPYQTDDSNLSDISSPSATGPSEIGSPTIPPAPSLPTSFAKSLPFAAQIQFSQSSKVTTQPFSIPQQTSPTFGSFSLAGTSLPSGVFSAKINNSVTNSLNNNKSRPKKQKPKTQPKAKVIKFHEYKGPPNLVKSTQPVPANVTIVGTQHNSDTPYHILLQQQQLFLQWQLEFNQKNNPSSVPVILPAHKEGHAPPTVLQVAVGTSGTTTIETSTPESKPITVMSHTTPHTVFTMNTPHKAPGALPQIQQIRIASPAVSHIKQEPLQVGQPQPQMNPQCSISQPVTKPPLKKVTLPSPTTNAPTKQYTTFEEMKVAELKAELKKRNLPVSGPKPVLIEKLKPYADSILKCVEDKTPTSVSVTSPDCSASSALTSPSSKSTKVGVMSPQSMVMSPPPLPALSSSSIFMSQSTAAVSTSATIFSRPASVQSLGPASVQSLGPASVQSFSAVSSPGSVQSSVNSSVSSPPGSVGSYQSSVLSRPGSIMSPLGDIIDETLTDVLSPLASIQSMQSAVNVSNISPTSPLFMDMPLSPDLMDLNITSPPDYSVSNNNMNKSLNTSQTNVNNVNSAPVEMEQSRPPSVLSLVQSEQSRPPSVLSLVQSEQSRPPSVLSLVQSDTGKIDTTPMDIDLSLSQSLSKGFLESVGCIDNASQPNSQPTGPSSVPFRPSPQPSPQLICPSPQSVFIPSPPPLPTFNQRLVPGLRQREQPQIPGQLFQKPVPGLLAQPQVSIPSMSPPQQQQPLSSLSPTQLPVPSIPLAQQKPSVPNQSPTHQQQHQPVSSLPLTQQQPIPGLLPAQQQQHQLLQQIQSQLLQQTQQVEQLQQQQQQQKQLLGEPMPDTPRHMSQDDLLKQQQNKIEALQCQLEESQLRLKIQQLQHQQLQQQQQQLQQQGQQLAQLKQQQAALEQSQKHRQPTATLPPQARPPTPQAAPLPPAQAAPIPQASPKPAMTGMVPPRPMQISTPLPFPPQSQPVQAQTHAPMQQVPAPAPAMSQAQGQTRPLVQTTRTPQPSTSVQNPQSPPQVVFNVPSLPNGAKVSSLQNLPPNTKQIQIPANLLQDLQNNQGLPIIVTQNPKLAAPRGKPPSLEFIKNQAINQTINLGAGKSLISVSTAPGGVQHFIITTSVAQKGSTPATSMNGLSQPPPQPQKMATSLPTSPVEARPVSRTSSNPFFIPMREPPKYDEAVKNKHPPPQVSPSPATAVGAARPGGGAAVKSQAMDDVLEILIRTGELPESAAQEPPPTPKTTSQTATIPTVSVSHPAGLPAHFTPTPNNRMSAELNSTGALHFPQPPVFSTTVEARNQTTTTTMANSQTNMADYFPIQNGYAPMDNIATDLDIKLEVQSPQPPDLVPVPPMSEHNSNDLFDLNDVISSDLNSMDWSSDPAFGDLDFSDTTNMAMDVKFSFPNDNSLLSIPMASSPHKSSHGSEPDLANLGLGDMDTNTNMQIDVPDWLDVIMPSTGLTPLSANAPVAFPADPILTPRTQQEVLDLFNFDDSELNTPSDLNSGSNWDKLTGTMS